MIYCHLTLKMRTLAYQLVGQILGMACIIGVTHSVTGLASEPTHRALQSGFAEMCADSARPNATRWTIVYLLNQILISNWDHIVETDEAPSLHECQEIQTLLSKLTQVSFEIDYDDADKFDFAIFHGLSNVRRLMLQRHFNQKHLQDLSANPHIESLQLSGCGSSGFECDIGILGAMPNLRRLELRLGSAYYRGIERAPLEELTISDYRSPPDMMEIVGKMVNLRTLSYRHSSESQFNLDSLDFLRPLTNLRYLEVTGRYGGCEKSLNFSDLAPLINMKYLSILSLCSPKIRDISPLAGMNDMVFLRINSPFQIDYSPLESLTRPHANSRGETIFLKIEQ